jgi:hypothetical protein
MEELNQAQHKAAASLYQQASAAGSGGPTPGGSADAEPSASGPAADSGGAKSGDVIDAEVVDEGKP